MAKDQEVRPPAQGLTPNDPVSQEELARLEELDKLKQGIANKNLDLDQEKIKLLGAAKRIDMEYQSAFDKILVDRGISPGTRVFIEKNGRLRLNQERLPQDEMPEVPPPQEEV